MRRREARILSGITPLCRKPTSPAAGKDKQRIGNKVPFCQPPRILKDTMKPFQAAALHPRRSALHDTGVKVESGPDAHHYRLNPAPVRLHPSLLLRTTKPDPDDLCSRPVYMINDCCVFFLREFPERRRNRANYLDSRKCKLQHVLQALKSIRRGAIEENTDI